MRLIAFVTASPLFAFEMNVPCQASPESRSTVCSGERARYAATWPASAAMPPSWKLVAPLRTLSASRCPWMSSVWRIWIRSAANPGFAGAAVGWSGRHATTSDTKSARHALRRLLLVRAVLQLVEAMVDAALREQVAVRPHLHDPSFVKDDDAVDVLDR